MNGKMKRWISALLMLALVMVPAMAEVSYLEDLDADGYLETVWVRLGLIPDQDGYQATMQFNVYDDDDTCVGSITPLDYWRAYEWDESQAPGSIWQMRVAKIGKKLLYVETSYSFEGTSYRYDLYEIDPAFGMTNLLEVINPGYTSGEGLYYGVDGVYDWTEMIYERSEEGATENYPNMVVALNDVFTSYGIKFRPDYRALLIDDQIICELDDALLAGEKLNDEGFVEFKSDPVEPQKTFFVRATGDVYVRTGPARNYDSIGVLKTGESAVFMNETQVDERPVTWYKVEFKGKTGWVSSTYSEIVD